MELETSFNNDHNLQSLSNVCALGGKPINIGQLCSNSINNFQP